jgi:murein L,D-transpeptidase YcbB/YkuD
VGAVFATLWLAVAGIAAIEAGSPPTAEAAALRELLDQPGGVLLDGHHLEVAALQRFYRQRSFLPAWSRGPGAGERAARLLHALDTADAHGLDPAAYPSGAIRARSARAGQRVAAERDLLLTDAFLRYATDVASGRLRPEQVEPDWGIAAVRLDPVEALTRTTRAPETFAAVLASLPPPAAGYRRLVEAWRRYRRIAAGTGWPALAPGPMLRPGDRDDRVPALRRRLGAEDDRVSPGSGADYDAPLAAAVRRFQLRHGLAVDGVVGPATLGALNVSTAERLRQIGLNLERWRWLPRDPGERYLAVNAADATLGVVVDGRTVLASRVVVGDARHPTPMAQARIEAVVFNPPWNVPTSIAAAEMLPTLREDARYLVDNDIVILDRQETDPYGLIVDWASVPADPFPFRLQQRPGARNPLGQIKFDMPNRFDVYLHDTPARSLFARPVRTSSHGCIRVERARDLATYLLSGQPGGGREAIERAIATGHTQRLPVDRPLPVYLVYWTAFVDEAGAVQFRDDVYGRDRRLAAALAGTAPADARTWAPGSAGCPAGDEEAGR